MKGFVSDRMRFLAGKAAGALSHAGEGLRETAVCARCWAEARCPGRGRFGGESGQGTTEYAILVGVLVVIAIVAITLFRPKIQELWDAIATGINGL